MALISPFSVTWRNDVAALFNGGGADSKALIRSGIWTPTVSTAGDPFTGITYALQQGHFVADDLGSGLFKVWAAFRLQFTPDVGSASGAINVDGLQSAWTIADAVQNYGGSVSNMNDQWTWAANRTAPTVIANQANNTIRIVQLGTGQNIAALLAGNLTDDQSHTLEAAVTFLATKA